MAFARLLDCREGVLSIYQEIPEIPVGMLMGHMFSMRSTEKLPGISGILKR